MAVVLVVLKILVTIVIVVGLSVVAEHVSPRVAGILSGYPLVAAIALFFIGLDVGPDFAAESAVYTIAGLVGSLCFVYAYHRAALHFKKATIPLSSAAATVAYFAAIAILQSLGLSKTGAVLLTVGATLAFAILFRHIEDAQIERPVRLIFRVLLLRAVLASGAIVIITGAAKWVGPRWAGLFSAFPTTLFPLMLIVHVGYGQGPVNTIIKNFPRGLGSLIFYALSVSVMYPRCGVYWGTLAAFAAASGYLAVYGALVVKGQRRKL
ncbi:MAG: hypothetical protein WAO07_14580 [Desulfobacterales bacterium]